MYINRVILKDDVMDEGYLLLEQDDNQRSYYLACTKSGAIYYGAVNEAMELASDWKLISVDVDAMETVH